MKITITKQIMMLAAAAVVCSCVSSDEMPASGGAAEGEGQLVISGMSVSQDMRETSIGTRADGDISPDNFTTKITNTDTSTSYYNATYGAFASPMTLPAGNYSISVESHEVQPAEWDNIYYAVSDTFVIAKNETTTKDDLVCKVSNILVSVNFSDAMLALMEDDCKTEIKVGSCGPLTYDADEERVGCFQAEADANSLVWNFTGTIKDEYYDEEGFILNAKAGEHHTLNFDVEITPDPEKGDVEFIFTVSVECTVYDVNLNVAVEKETVIEPFETVITIESDYDLSSVNTLKLSESLDGSNQPIIDLGMDVTADNGIESVSVLLTTDNAALQGALEAAGITGRFELATVEDPFKAVLEGFGFPTGDAVAGKNELTLNLSGMLPMLFGLGENIDRFDVEVTVCDAQDNLLTKTMKLKLVDDTQVSSVTIEGDGFDINQRMEISAAAIEELTAAGELYVVKVNINAPEGVDHFVVGISSTDATFAGIITTMGFTSFDIANPESLEMEEALEMLGLPYGNQVKDQTEMTFDISSFIPLLTGFVADDSGFEADFTLTVTDNEGNVETRTIMMKLTL